MGMSKAPICMVPLQGVRNSNLCDELSLYLIIMFMNIFVWLCGYFVCVRQVLSMYRRQLVELVYVFNAPGNSVAFILPTSIHYFLRQEDASLD